MLEWVITTLLISASVFDCLWSASIARYGGATRRYGTGEGTEEERDDAETAREGENESGVLNVLNGYCNYTLQYLHTSRHESCPQDTNIIIDPTGERQKTVKHSIMYVMYGSCQELN